MGSFAPEPIHATSNKNYLFEHMQAIAPEPEDIDYEADLKSVLGVDSNEDGVRDSLNNLAWGLFILNPEGTKKEYEKVLTLMTYMHPKEPFISGSIDMNKVYCDYLELPTFIHTETKSFKNFYHYVINTDKRRSAFAKSVIKQKEQPQVFCPSLWTAKSRSLLGFPEPKLSQ